MKRILSVLLICALLLGGVAAFAEIEAQPKGVKLIKNAMTIRVAQKARVSGYLTGKSRIEDLEITSDDTSVATTYVEGNKFYVIGQSAGITYVRATVGSSSDEILITVKPPIPSSVQMSMTQGNMAVREQMQLSATVLPQTADQRVAWTSGNKKIASVDKNGVVTALRPGRVSIIATTVDGKKKEKRKGVCTINVTNTPVGGKAYVLAIGNRDYPDRGYTDSAAIASMEGFVSTVNRMRPGGFNIAKVEKKTNLKDAPMRAALDELRYLGQSSNDVTIFYYCGLGSYSNGEAWLSTTEKNYGIPVSTLASILNQVAGKVFVIIDCNASGGFIGKNAAAQQEAFNDAVVSAFRKNQPASKDTLTGVKYHVLTSMSRYETETSFVNSAYGPWKLFTGFLADGCGYDVLSRQATGKLSADTNGDGRVTFQEAYAYSRDNVRSFINSYNSRYGDNVPMMTVQIYPTNDATIFLSN